MLFTGQYEHTIDAKGRLAIPADIRSRWRTEEEGSAWFAVPWLVGGTQGLIRLYTERAFHDKASMASQSLMPDEDEAETQATLFGFAARLSMDSAGRVRIPEETLQLVGLGPEVVLVGAGDRLEIRDRAGWKENQSERLAKLAKLIERSGSRGREE